MKNNDLGTGGFLAILSLLLVAILPLTIFVLPVALVLVWAIIPALALCGFIWSVRDVRRGNKMAWASVCLSVAALSVAALLLWWFVKKF